MHKFRIVIADYLLAFSSPSGGRVFGGPFIGGTNHGN